MIRPARLALVLLAAMLAGACAEADPHSAPLEERMRQVVCGLATPDGEARRDDWPAKVYELPTLDGLAPVAFESRDGATVPVPAGAWGGYQSVPCGVLTVDGRLALPSELSGDDERIGLPSHWFHVGVAEVGGVTEGWVPLHVENYRISRGGSGVSPGVMLVTNDETFELPIVAATSDSGQADLRITRVEPENLAGQPCIGTGQHVGDIEVSVANQGTGVSASEFDVEITYPNEEAATFTQRWARGLLPGEDVVLLIVRGGTRVDLKPDQPLSEQDLDRLALEGAEGYTVLLRDDTFVQVGAGRSFVCVSP